MASLPTRSAAPLDTPGCRRETGPRTRSSRPRRAAPRPTPVPSAARRRRWSRNGLDPDLDQGQASRPRLTGGELASDAVHRDPPVVGRHRRDQRARNRPDRSRSSCSARAESFPPLHDKADTAGPYGIRGPPEGVWTMPRSTDRADGRNVPHRLPRSPEARSPRPLQQAGNGRRGPQRGLKRGPVPVCCFVATRAGQRPTSPLPPRRAEREASPRRRSAREAAAPGPDSIASVTETTGTTGPGESRARYI